MKNIVIANLGTGNLHSVKKAVEFVGEDRQVSISDAPEEIGNADSLVLPEQGAIGTWMAQLAERPEMETAIRHRLENGPVLGVCIGLQALFDFSEESNGVKGLGVFRGNVRHFTEAGVGMEAKSPNGQNSTSLKVPHMGWNQVRQTHSHPLWQGIADDARFYFVHSYFASAGISEDVAGECEYGIRFTAAASRGNIFATQFHPEKSHQAGLQLLRNFINWNGVH